MFGQQDEESKLKGPFAMRRLREHMPCLLEYQHDGMYSPCGPYGGRRRASRIQFVETLQLFCCSEHGSENARPRHETLLHSQGRRWRPCGFPKLLNCDRERQLDRS